ncbi:hypothetical protein [uncultured Senegalimassilia sp.]|uniref:hypothetical protein n=1 Tax=uncultured Senegalimassilia sp. TaxID=1714350 RepID=UPI0026771EA1|nr:hypothetical protein [uncultured Senegalimassilia sp.]
MLILVFVIKRLNWGYANSNYKACTSLLRLAGWRFSFLDYCPEYVQELDFLPNSGHIFEKMNPGLRVLNYLRSFVQTSWLALSVWLSVPIVAGFFALCAGAAAGCLLCFDLAGELVHFSLAFAFDAEQRAAA